MSEILTAPLVSVLIPCFNAEAVIGQAIESVLAQTYSPIEIVVVDDGSTDGSMATLERYRKYGVAVFKQARGSAAAARNRALAESRGDFVLFLDADDVIAHEHIRLLLSRLEHRDGYVAMGEWDRFRFSPAEAKFPHRPGNRDATGVDWLVEDWSDGQQMTQCGSFLIPRSLLKRVGGWDERLSLIDDFEFFARLLVGSSGVLFAFGARLYYRSGTTGSLSGRRSRSAAESSCMSLLLGTTQLLQVENSARVRRACANVLMTFEFDFYPAYSDLRCKVRRRISELGGGDLEPAGPPTFHRLRRCIGWRPARLVQLLVQRIGRDHAARLQTAKAP